MLQNMSIFPSSWDSFIRPPRFTYFNAVVRTVGGINTLLQRQVWNTKEEEEEPLPDNLCHQEVESAALVQVNVDNVTLPGKRLNTKDS